MIFLRTLPERLYRDYTAYRPLLRRDFLYRCAYCLTHEYFLGGEAGCCIDHFRPVHGPFGRPDLVSDYDNLYWCCRECNENKGDFWPSPEDYAAGLRFLEACRSEDDHDLHWHILPDGVLEPQTPAGAYTVRHLKLWRPLLQHYRAKTLLLQQEVRLLRDQLHAKHLPAAQRAALERRVAEIDEWLVPPAFDRPRHDTPSPGEPK